AISLGAFCNAALLLRELLRRGIYTPQRGWGTFGFKLAVAVYAMSAVLWLAAGEHAAWLTAGATERAARLAGIVALGAVTYFGALWILGFRPADFSRKAAA